MGLESHLTFTHRLVPGADVVAWFAKRPPTTLYLSVVTLGENRKGVQGVDDTSRRQLLTDWLETDLPSFLPDAF